MAIELLAPGGSYESCMAAFQAGADAVYLGGSKFGARAYADNLGEEQMLHAIDYAHLHGKKLYLTVNTLLKDSEVELLYPYLLPFYREGLDAVIVQDFGVMEYIKSQFPGMDIHASTQMTATGAAGATFLKEFGASRVVTSRELTLPELAVIHEQVDIEIESFVHGALCYCYSGQCLLSSMIGGRSGNRGRCAQPCRLPYRLFDESRELSKPSSSYLLSPKDMCSLDLIPEISQAGVYSFKMEGRMKKPEYTAGITNIYRKYIDLYLSKGTAGYKVEEQDRLILMDLYNRGGFSQGYYKQHNGSDMMSMARPNHMGTPAVKIIQTGKVLSCKALSELHPKDILELPAKKETLDLTFDQTIPKGQTFSLKPIRGVTLKKDQTIYRTRNQVLIDSLTERYIKREIKEKINGILILSVGKPAKLTVCNKTISCTVTGEEVQAAQNRPLTETEIEKQLRKTGQTSFTFDQLQIILEGSVFLPMQSLNLIRRSALMQLQEQMLLPFQRAEKPCLLPDDFFAASSSVASIFASVESMEQLNALLEIPDISRIYVSYILFSDKNLTKQDCLHVISRCHQHQKECYLITPWMERKEACSTNPALRDTYSLFDGLLVKSMETFAFLHQTGFDKPLVADHNLYTWNQPARSFLHRQGFIQDTAPVEMNYSELRKRGLHGSDLLVYGHIPLMISAQCIHRNLSGCDHKPGILYLKDRKNIVFPVRNLCTYCSNIIYNSSPLELIDHIDEIAALNPDAMRLSFTVEDFMSTRQIATAYVDAIRNHKKREPLHRNFTRGHFKRGVE